MTAANAQPAKHVPAHAATKTARKLHLPKFRTETTVTPTHKVVAATKRVTPTGQALYSVDAKGEVSRNAVALTRDGIATFASFTSTAMDVAYPSHWFVQLFESEQERRTRVNAQAASAILRFVAKKVSR